jgi:hypothetical protein
MQHFLRALVIAAFPDLTSPKQAGAQQHKFDLVSFTQQLDGQLGASRAESFIIVQLDGCARMQRSPNELQASNLELAVCYFFVQYKCCKHIGMDGAQVCQHGEITKRDEHWEKNSLAKPGPSDARAHCTKSLSAKSVCVAPNAVQNSCKNWYTRFTLIFTLAPACSTSMVHISTRHGARRLPTYRFTNSDPTS